MPWRTGRRVTKLADASPMPGLLWTVHSTGTSESPPLSIIRIKETVGKLTREVDDVLQAVCDPLARHLYQENQMGVRRELANQAASIGALQDVRCPY